MAGNAVRKMASQMRPQKDHPVSRAFRLDYHSPIGTIEIVGTECGVASVIFREKEPTKAKLKDAPSPVEAAFRQLDEYFKGKREIFTVRLDLQGSEFQEMVWRRLLRIPYGETASYGEIAAAVGRPKAVRAVGSANRLNKINIFVPCHRVIGHNGGLVGYGGGLWRKKWLIAHERENKKRRSR